jgi:hypothetical protein
MVAMAAAMAAARVVATVVRSRGASGAVQRVAVVATATRARV